MKYSVEIGEVEKHLVEYNFNQLIGSLRIQVDKQPVYRSTRLINEPVHEEFHFVVGHAEKSAVRIEKQRRQLFGHRNRVYVNNRLTRVIDGF